MVLRKKHNHNLCFLTALKTLFSAKILFSMEDNAKDSKDNVYPMSPLVIPVVYYCNNSIFL